MKRLRLPNKQSKRGVLISAPLFVLLIIFFFGSLSSQSESSIEQAVSVLSPFRAPVYSLDQIEGIHRIYASLEMPEETSKTDEPAIRSAILPHHTLLGEELVEFWNTIASHSNPSVVVLIGPAHEDQGAELVQITHGTWETPFGQVVTDEFFIDSLNQSGVSIEPAFFQNEHSIGVHLPYIAKFFPDTPIVPIIAKSSARDREAQQVAEDLHHILPDDALLVASIDFAHYLDARQSDENDQVTAQAIEERDYARMFDMGPDYLDSAFSLETYLMYGDAIGCRQEQVWHENNSRLAQNVPDWEGTSYLVYFCWDDAPISITAAGDMMLGRGVQYWLSKTTIEDAYKDAKTLFESAEIGFANLESVMTDIEPSTGKAIHFKGMPENIEVLNYIGLTHVSVSNNHVDDYGERGWIDSVQNVEDAGIETVGGYRNDGEIVYTEVNGKTLAFVAHENLTFALPIEDALAKIREAAKNSDLVIASYHWDREYMHEPLEDTIDIAHRSVQAGADIVIGHHPHVLQGIEVYQDALILYSLGNFTFDQEGFDENESAVMRIQWTEQERSLEITPIRIKGGFPRIASAEESSYTLGRLAGWSDGALREQILDGFVQW